MTRTIRIHKIADGTREETECGKGSPPFVTREWTQVTCPRCLSHAPITSIAIDRDGE